MRFAQFSIFDFLDEFCLTGAEGGPYGRMHRNERGKFEGHALHANDMNFIAIAENGHLVGFNVLVGGGLAVRPNHKRRFPTEKIGVDRSSALCGLTAHNLQDWLADQGIDIKGIGLFLIGIRL